MTTTEQTTAADRSRLARHVRNLYDFGEAFDEIARTDFSGFPEPPPGWSVEDLFRGSVDDLEGRVRRLRIIGRCVFGQQLEKYRHTCERLDLRLI